MIPRPGVTVGRSNQEADLIAAPKAVSHHLDRRVGPAGKHVKRRIIAQDLFHRGLDGGLAQGGKWRPGLKQRLHPVADGMHRRLVPGIQQKDAGRDQLIRRQRLTRHFRRDQMGDQIIGRLRPACLDIIAQKSHERFGGGHCTGLDLGGASGHVHAHHGIRPAHQVGRHRFGHSKQPCNDAHRQGLGKSPQQVELTRREGADEILGKGADVRGQRRDPA